MADKLLVLEEFYATKVWFLNWPNGIRVTAISLKIQPGSILAILKAISAEGPMVAFAQVKSLDELRRKLSDPQGISSIKWRPDQYGLDKNS